MDHQMPLVIFEESISVLPESVRTRDGAGFDPRSTRWAFRDSVKTISLDFSTLVTTPAIVTSLKATLVWYAENKSSHHLANMFERFAHFLRTVSNGGSITTCITANDLLSYRSLLKAGQSWYLGNLSGLLQKWHSLGLYGVTDDAVAFLKQARIKGNRKGEAVLTMDAQNGPYSDIELESIYSALDASHEANETDLSEYLLVWLFIALGQRPIQYASLKLRDFVVGVGKDGASVYTLKIPRAKQRGQPSRAVFKDRVLIPQIGKKLVQLQEEVARTFLSVLPDSGQAPLFPAKYSRKNEPSGFEYHRTAHSLADTLKRILDRLSVTSERTGEPIHITATRFRRTLGTRAAVEGHGELVIAELLDHTDTQNAGIYVQAVPAIVERIDRAVALHLAPLAQAFSGLIIDDESKASRGNDTSSRICDPRYDPTMKPMGNCGKHGFCGQLAPIACYTCRSFEPWLDGPHERVLEHLISERERLLSGSDIRIASVNDRTILAVAEVVRRCDVIRNGGDDFTHV
jgi:integrase